MTAAAKFEEAGAERPGAAKEMSAAEAASTARDIFLMVVLLVGYLLTSPANASFAEWNGILKCYSRPPAIGPPSGSHVLLCEKLSIPAILCARTEVS